MGIKRDPVLEGLFTNYSFTKILIPMSRERNFQKCDREKLLSIPDSEFYPGHFNWLTLQFDEFQGFTNEERSNSRKTRKIPAFWRETNQ